ncbi:unnamed protein product [Rotaria socialis]|uniref:N-acetylmuramoyl-L-alanine amidase n=1 Tax=Rotaria socialis TaxID=392032 RepID=A0A821U3X5_9BILA|nr:unnamed protein product [Rotaria socialis]CAF4882346.1 unnamed protein product [Rotaria socialis]
MSTQAKPITKDNNNSSILLANNNWKVDYSKAKKVVSPNYKTGRPAPICGLVLHGTAGGGTIEWFLNPASKVSSHYVVEQDGTVTQMVSETDVAWHAGVVSPTSILADKGNPNGFCIGIEFSRNKTNDNIMPDVQILSGLDLVNDIRGRYPHIQIYFHDEISIGRICPGPNFPKTLFRA